MQVLKKSVKHPLSRAQTCASETCRNGVDILQIVTSSRIRRKVICFRLIGLSYNRSETFVVTTDASSSLSAAGMIVRAEAGLVEEWGSCHQ